MKKILLIRHSQSYANLRDFTAFGNEDSPLTEKGIKRAKTLNTTLREKYDTIPEDYDEPVMASNFTRTQQTAQEAGFNNIDINPLINESDPKLDAHINSGTDVISKHVAEGWVPDDVKSRAKAFISQVEADKLDYEIFFTHGMFIAGALAVCDALKIPHSTLFNEKRGYIPLQTGIVELSI